MKNLLTIGTTELMTLPDSAIADIPAKIDTGADNSAIWASNIHLEEGKVVFNLFAPGSVYYREEPVVVSNFRTTTVRNSFGHKEFRYKVQFNVCVGEHKLQRWFTLADRSRNNYPILLGKNFLKNKFIVDVSQKNIVSKHEVSSKVLIFTKDVEESNAFFDEVRSNQVSPIKYECIPYSALWFTIDGKNTRVRNTIGGKDIADYSFTFFKNHHSREFSWSAAEYLQFRGRPFADTEFTRYMSGSKLSEYTRLACFGLNVPLTFCAKTPILKDKFADISKRLGLPFVLKEFKSDKGKFNYLIQAKKDFETILKEAPKDHIYIAQKYIPNDGFYRLYIMGKEMSLAIWRSSVPHENPLKGHLNKPKGSANAKNIELDNVPGEAQDLALRAADCMNRQIAGVDLVQDKNTGVWYILEVNNDPQIRSGSFVAEKAAMVAKYFEAELNQ
ncbi:MAG: hypothetical protein JWO35_876 [Candidatus Saccharibacteria bacterium]|nr:hypothetical protein [Candidatus Saccharibacteria bacterium]